MKINYDEYRNKRVKAVALHRTNKLVRDARKQMLKDLPRALRKRFNRQLQAARVSAFVSSGIVVPYGTNILNRKQRRQFMATLEPDQKVVIYKQMADAVKNAAVTVGLPHIAELEDLRKIQIDGAVASETDEDINAITQITRDSAENIHAKHKIKRAEHNRLSGGAAVPDRPGKKPA